MARGLPALLGGLALCLACKATHGEQQQQQQPRDVSFEELTFEAAKHGMEVIPEEEWMNTRRRLQYEGGWVGETESGRAHTTTVSGLL